MLLLPAHLTVLEARATLQMLVQALKRESKGGVTIDASQLKQFDSAALAVLLECRRLTDACGRIFEVRNMPTKLVALANLYGVSALLKIKGDSATVENPLPSVDSVKFS